MRSSTMPPELKRAGAALLCCALFALASCSNLRPRPAVVAPPARPPRTIPATPMPAPAATPPVVPPPPAHDYAQDANAAKQALSKSERESLPAADVGYYMDVLLGRLKSLAGANVGVGRNGKVIVIVLTGAAGFEPASAQPNAGMRETLARLSGVLSEYRQSTVAVRVRGDDAGAANSNPQLTEQRRVAIADALVAGGIANKRIVLASAPPPHAPTAKAKSGNSLRVELQLEPIVRATTASH